MVLLFITIKKMNHKESNNTNTQENMLSSGAKKIPEYRGT